MSRRTNRVALAVTSLVAIVAVPASGARADDLGALNTLFVLPVAVVMLAVLLAVGIWGAVGLRGAANRGMNVARIVALVVCGARSLAGAPAGVILLELWTDQYQRAVSWNPVNFAICGVVAVAGLGCLVLALGLGARELRRGRG